MPSQHDSEDWILLKLANEKGKFTLALGQHFPDIVPAFERGIEFGWFTMVDLAPIASAGMVMCRVYRLTGIGELRRAALKKMFVSGVDDDG